MVNGKKENRDYFNSGWCIKITSTTCCLHRDRVPGQILKALSTVKRVCLKRVSCVTTMYVIKWWRREETCDIPHLSSLLHHFITYIVVTHETHFKHTPFGRQPLNVCNFSWFAPTGGTSGLNKSATTKIVPVFVLLWTNLCNEVL